MKEDKSARSIMRLFHITAMFFCAALLVSIGLAIGFSCHDRYSRIRSSMDKITTYTRQEYSSIADNFWQAFVPLVEASGEESAALSSYFQNSDAPKPFEQVALREILQKMCLRDNRISWILLYSPTQENSIIQYSGDIVLQTVPEDFPYLDRVRAKQKQMEIYGSDIIQNVPCFAIAGGIPSSYGEGTVLIGYRTSSFRGGQNLIPSFTETMQYYILSGDQVIYNSDETGSSGLYFPSSEGSGVRETGSGRWYVLVEGVNPSSYIVCAIDRGEMLREMHTYTPFLAMLSAAFFAFAFFLARSIQKQMDREVSIIRHGLNEISASNLGYRIPAEMTHENLNEIAQDINQMSSRLDESIRRAYYFELKQKDAQMAEMQATFNPHFLYNTLEMLRNRCYQNGDEDTASLIASMAAIFRSVIGAKTFVPFREELALSRRYVSLMVQRYGDIVKFRYDIDSSVLSSGIIRNVFQILIENYFVHGFDAARTDNEIDFVSKSLNEHDILVQVTDNGSGMTEEQLDELNRSIAEPPRHNRKNFGLRNLNQRLKLFYGPDYGLTVSRNAKGGVTVSIRIRRMTVEEYEKEARARAELLKPRDTRL
ncbi:MAG: sensor histidine kinase [Lachnospiraceae bacterium]|jgi:signal transduction histidine kinase